MSNNIIYIAKDKNNLDSEVENCLETLGITVHALADDVDEIYKHRREADIFLFDVQEDSPQTASLIKYLAEICHDGYKSFCLIADEDFIAKISDKPIAKEIFRTYPKPLAPEKFAGDMLVILTQHDEFRRKKDILIVDDDSDFLMIMKLWLRNSYNVTGVRSGAEALEKITKKNFDLILLDYEMPEMDGYEVMKQIHKNPDTAHIPIIFLTGLNDRDSVMQILKHRPDGYILKSMKKLELLNTLEKFFAENVFK